MGTAYKDLVDRLHERLPEVEFGAYKALLDKACLEAQMDGYAQARMIHKSATPDKRPAVSDNRPCEYPCGQCRQVRPQAVMTFRDDGLWYCKSEDYHALIDGITLSVTPEVQEKWFPLLNQAIEEAMREVLSDPDQERAVREMLGLD